MDVFRASGASCSAAGLGMPFLTFTLAGKKWHSSFKHGKIVIPALQQHPDTCCSVVAVVAGHARDRLQEKKSRKPTVISRGHLHMLLSSTGSPSHHHGLFCSCLLLPPCSFSHSCCLLVFRGGPCPSVHLPFVALTSPASVGHSGGNQKRPPPRGSAAAKCL